MKEREYVDGATALSKLMNGEWEKTAFDNTSWIDNFGYLYINGLDQIQNHGRLALCLCLSKEWFIKSKWYEATDE